MGIVLMQENILTFERGILKYLGVKRMVYTLHLKILKQKISTEKLTKKLNKNVT